ncbi:MAG: acyl-CoA thioesterase, partial [Polaromonas sp.]|nr:acyl-CoA thioesterase [Polaromonas sp.]
IGVIGTPLVDTPSRFLRTATYGDTLNIQVTIPEWREKSFVQRYRIMRGEELIMECNEVRIFAGRRADNPEAIRALPIPAEIRTLCE